MAQKHVDFLVEAAALDDDKISWYVCDKLGHLANENGMYYIMADLKHMIEQWLLNNGGYRVNCRYLPYSFDYTPISKEGVSRAEWVESTLIPLALQLPD